MRGSMFVKNQMRIIFLSCHHFSIFQATLRMPFKKIDEQLYYNQENCCSEYLNRKVGKQNIFSEVKSFFTICVSKIFFKNF